VKGKNILWISLIAIMLSAMMVNTTIAPQPPETRVYIDRDRLPDQPGDLAHVGDEFVIAIMIENVVDLYAIGFTVKYAPYGKTLVASDIAEGEFLKRGGKTTGFAYSISVFAGTVKIGISRLGAVPGESGSGTLATLKLTKAEAGDSPIEIVDSGLLDSSLNYIEHETSGSYCHGVIGNLINANMPDGRHISVSSSVGTFMVKAKNHGDVNITVRARLEVERQHDSRRVRLYNGQTYFGGYLGADPPFTYLYCDGYDGAYSEWTKYGASPYLNATGEDLDPPGTDGNYIESFDHAAWDAFYSFEDLDMPYLGIYNVISNVDFYGYTKSTSVDPDIDPYCFTTAGGTSYSFMWCDSMGGTTDWAWTGVRYYYGRYDFPEYYGFPLTDEAVDNMELLLYNYHGDDGLWVDALRARVEFATIVPIEPPVTTIEPGEEVWLDPILWVPVEDHIGKYDATITLEYSEKYDDVGYHWKNTGEKVKSFFFWVDP
jgi:hypothetical protein